MKNTHQSVSTSLRAWGARLSLVSFAALVACGGGQDSIADPVEEDIAGAIDGPVDNGHRSAIAATQAREGVAAGVPAGNPNAQTQGVFGPVVSLPLMPIHEVLLPDGRVLMYGGDITGLQGGALHYAVWDPSLGSGANAFTVLPTVTGTDIFCAGQALLPQTGDVLIVGGTLTINGKRGFGTSESNLFSTSGNTLLTQDVMAWRRWYPTLLTLASGQQLVMGGRIDAPAKDDDSLMSRTASAAPAATTTPTYATTPELWTPNVGWHTLSGAMSEEAFGTSTQAWYYPRAWVMPSGNVFVLGTTGTMFQLDATGDGAITTLAPKAKSAKLVGSNARLQSVMYQPGKILSLRAKLSTVTIDINGAQPVIAATSPTARSRLFGNATLLADGQVWVNGGSTDGNVATGDWFVSETWNPTTGTWTDGATATVPRLYHSTALLLPDATVLTGGGGDPGPFTNLNAEVYYPPYLFLKDGTGTPAPRPAIASAPDSLGWNAWFKAGVTSSTAVSRVTLVRTGTVTHDFNSNQRFQDLKFTQSGDQLTIRTPATTGVAPPGYYMLFVFDAAGVPSVAKIIRLA